jgi:tetratricopeptide (TPR) repeat protein
MLTLRRVPVLLVLVTTIAGCDEDAATAHHRLAVELYKKGDFAKAAAEYDEYFRLDGSVDEQIQRKGAQAWAKSGDYVKAVAILQRLADAKQGTEKVDAYRQIAGMWLQTARDLDKAEEWFNKVLAMDPKDEASMGWLAEIAAARGGARNQAAVADPKMLDLALDRFDRVLAMNPNNIGTYVNKRIVYIKYLNYLQKQKEQALNDAEVNKKDKATAKDFSDKADAIQVRWDAMKGSLDKLGEQIAELTRAAKASREGDGGTAPSAGDAGTPAVPVDGGSAADTVPADAGAGSGR